MSEGGAEQDRSEKPSAHKLDQARKRGQVARSADLGFLVGLAAFTAYIWLVGPKLAHEISTVARAAIVSASGVATSEHALLTLFGAMIVGATRPLLMMVGAIFLAVLVFEVVQTGGVFATEALKFDFSRLNPATGLKRLFSVRLLIEAGKNILKMATYAALAWLTVAGAVATGIPAITDAGMLARGLQHYSFRLMAMFIGAAVVFAILDQLIVRRDFLKKMRMSRREVKRESRDREGEPRMKQRRKQLHREFVKSSESLRNIRGADVLVTNPTHFAVALRYDPKVMDAPTVVSRGAQAFALRLRRVAFVYGVIIVREPALARALYRCELNQPVPEALFEPVASVYRGMRKRAAALPEPVNV